MPTALVTGASRGVGRGLAIALADAGFSVYATGRGIDGADLPAAIGRLRCDHTIDADVHAAFAQIPHPLDILINNAWGGYERMVDGGAFTWGVPFWQQPVHRWTSMMDAGLRAAFFASAKAAPGMVAQKSGLIVNISFWAAQRYTGNAIYGISKAATDKLTADLAHELRPHSVAVVSLYPGLVRTESVLEAAKQGWFNLDNSESPEFIGRVVAALYRAPDLMQRSGSVQVAAQVAIELGVTDIDGKQPRPLTLADIS
ncbi:MAG: SDR family NAD(P)-dependent oxidoreductase [Bryobacterales bacterium]|nr:SDR family NAD(P)-dependent oxidoreductase [Bryobacterales bacterium]